MLAAAAREASADASRRTGANTADDAMDAAPQNAGASNAGRTGPDAQFSPERDPLEGAAGGVPVEDLELDEEDFIERDNTYGSFFVL